jgi:hypothetical protein
VVFLLLAFTALIFLLLFNIDVHRVIKAKSQVQNAGDAAALAAARWQGSTLNLIGELNLLHALALAAPTPETSAAVDAITNMQARLCLTGPLTALVAAQIAAKSNHIFADPNPDLTDLLNFHIGLVKASTPPYSDTDAGPDANAWTEYENMLWLVANEKLAAIPDDIPLYSGPASNHPLLKKAFYEAVEGRDWCWFFLYAHGLLESYGSYHDWPPLPVPDASDAAEVIFDLGLSPYSTPLKDLCSAADLVTFVDAAGLGPVSEAAIVTNNVLEAVETWYVFDPKSWTAWDRINPDGEFAFPVAGTVRPEYDYAGADVVLGVSACVDLMPLGRVIHNYQADGSEANNSNGHLVPIRHTDGSTTYDLFVDVPRSNQVAWTAAAKPFGYLKNDAGEKQRPDSAAALVLPAFRDVRLIPVGSAAGSENSSSDLAWVQHVIHHLKPYLDIGPKPSDCRYCQALEVWEVPVFRQEGVGWLSTNSASCHIPTSGGGRRGGGSRKGH